MPPLVSAKRCEALGRKWVSVSQLKNLTHLKDLDRVSLLPNISLSEKTKSLLGYQSKTIMELPRFNKKWQ